MIINEYNGQEMYWKDIVSKFPNTIVCLSNYVDINKTDFRVLSLRYRKEMQRQ